MYQDQLKDFIKKHRELGTSDDSIKEILVIEGGWPESEIEEVFLSLDEAMIGNDSASLFSDMPSKPSVSEQDDTENKKSSPKRRGDKNIGLYERLEKKAKEKPGFVSFSS